MRLASAVPPASRDTHRQARRSRMMDDVAQEQGEEQQADDDSPDGTPTTDG